MVFKDRFDAARMLLRPLEKYKDNKDAVILAIPRGAIQIGYVLAKELKLPLDIVLTKKIGAPGHSEYAIGVVSMDTELIDPEYQKAFPDYIKKEIVKIRELLKKRYTQYKGDAKPIDLKNKIVIIVDDGIATGKTLISAVELIAKEKPKKIIVAIPVGSQEGVNEIRKKVDELICLIEPEIFYAVGQFYQNFEQVEDEEAIKLLREANK